MIRKKGRLLIIAIGSFVAIFIALGLYTRYSIRSAEKSAAEFCEEIVPGSNISAAIERADQRKVFYGPEGGYTFYFPTITGFDKATCGVVVDKDGVVLSKRSEMRYD